jgi:hypothetical protein
MSVLNDRTAADMAQIKASLAFSAACDAWSKSLRRAFGNRAGDRRYDMDKSGHPAECRALYAEFCRTRDAWYAAVHANRRHSA